MPQFSTAALEAMMAGRRHWWQTAIPWPKTKEKKSSKRITSLVLSYKSSSVAQDQSSLQYDQALGRISYHCMAQEPAI